VDRIVNNVEEKPFKENIDIDRRRVALNETWKHSKNPLIAVDYLAYRGIPTSIIEQAKDIRGHKSAIYIGENKERMFRPAMMALIRNAKGEAVSIHRTYLGINPKEKKIMPPIETITGGCVRLGEPQDTLVLAEGVETALAAWALTGHPAWATISAHGLAEFKAIPRHVKRVIIAADNDASFTGQAAAFECAKYMKQRVKVETIVTMPKIIGMDMLDVLNELTGDPKHSTALSQNDINIGLMRWSP
jgi:putative DNA primase/helicase